MKPEPASEAYLPRCFVYVGRQAGASAHDALGQGGPLYSRSGLVPDRRQPRRRQPAAAQLDRAVQRADRLHFGRRQGAVATAWEPYQELFQGVIVCLHSDFRIGGLKPGESKTIRGKIYLMPADLTELHERAIAATSPARNDSRPQRALARRQRS